MLNMKLFDKLFLTLGINYWKLITKIKMNMMISKCKSKKLGRLMKLKICWNYYDANNYT